MVSNTAILRSSPRRRRLPLLVHLAALVLTSAAGSGLAAAEPSDSCEYLKIYVEPDNHIVDGADLWLAEPLRKLILELAVEALPELGLRQVQDRSNAYLRLISTGISLESGDVVEQIGLDAELKLERHMFAVLMEDPRGFPYRGDLGSTSTAVLPRDRALAWLNATGEDFLDLRATVKVAMKALWDIEAEQMLALCNARSKLVEEGWADIEELRKELVLEIGQVRRDRRDLHQRKQLKLEAGEGTAP
jgi:hypothetical protein